MTRAYLAVVARPEMSLAQQAFTGVLWTAAERFGLQFVQLGVVVVLARMLAPADFGLVAMLTIVFAVSGVVVNGGFGAALIREREITEEDRCTALWLNIGGAVAVYGAIWLAAPGVARFFAEPRLVPLTRFMALQLIFLAPALVQQARLTHRLAFRRLGLIGLTAALAAGAGAVALALRGAGVWALAAQPVLLAAGTTLLLWTTDPWLPRRGISRRSFDRLFGFGSRLAASGLLNEVFLNIYKVVIGKYFAAATLGFYTQAHAFQRVASEGVAGILQQVSYPVLVKANDDPARLRRACRAMIQVSSFIIFPAMIGMALTADPLIRALLGEEWRPAVPFLRLLCVSGILYHLHSINLNVLQVVGRSDLYLRLELIKKANVTLAILIGLPFGIWGLLAGQVVASYVALFINMYYSHRFIAYPIREQLRHIAAVLVFSLPMALAVLAIGLVASDAPAPRLLLMSATGVAVYALTAVFTRAEPLRLLAAAIPPVPVLRTALAGFAVAPRRHGGSHDAR